MDELLKMLLTGTHLNDDDLKGELNNAQLCINLDAELEELQEDYALFEQCGGDLNLFREALAVDDDEVNRMLSDDFHYMPPVATYTELPHSSQMKVGDTIYIEEWEEAYIVMHDHRGRRWVKTHGNSFVTNLDSCNEITLTPMQPCTEFTHFDGEPTEPIEPIEAISKNVIQILRPRYDLVMERGPIDGINVDKMLKYLNTAMDEALAPKEDKRILSSRTPSHVHIIEKRAENDRRRRNAGKRILSSRD